MGGLCCWGSRAESLPLALAIAPPLALPPPPPRPSERLSYLLNPAKSAPAAKPPPPIPPRPARPAPANDELTLEPPWMFAVYNDNGPWEPQDETLPYNLEQDLD